MTSYNVIVNWTYYVKYPYVFYTKLAYYVRSNKACHNKSGLSWYHKKRTVLYHDNRHNKFCKSDVKGLLYINDFINYLTLYFITIFYNYLLKIYFL